ncbi:MAG: 4-amino-4-deoxychorismate lyase [Caulobacteraceae bacterium]|nr:4-amino-4-deoxychorismate lyase [Caulobacteraceae bacterium]
MIQIPADDRGFTLGHGLFETLLADAGGLHGWAAHLARLQRGCSVLGMPPPEETACQAAVAAAMRDAESPSGRFAIRLSWSAGSGGRGLDPPESMEPRLVVTAAPIGPSPPSLQLATVSIRRNERSPTSRLKTLAYLDNVLARREARGLDADEALMLNIRGEVSCVAAGNLVWVRGGVLFTPALSCGVLDGIMRAKVLARAVEVGLTVEETATTRDMLRDVEGLAVTNSLIGVCPVDRLDGEPLSLSPELAALKL